MIFRTVHAFVFVASLALAAAASAQNVRVKGGQVVLNEIPILTFRTSNGGLSPQARAAVVAKNLEAAGKSDEIKVRKVGQGHQILLNGAMLVNVTPAEAKANLSASEALAWTWAAKIKQALYLPAVQVSERQVTLPVGGLKGVRVVGSMVPVATFDVDQPKVAELTKTETGVIVRGLSRGDAVLVVQAGETIQTVEVKVRPYAASLPQTVTAQVVGNPALGSSVEGAVDYALKNLVSGEPGAKWAYKLPAASQVPIGTSKSFPVKVSVTAPDSYPAEGTVDVSVRNLVVPGDRDVELWYSNNPESVKGPQPLFAARLEQKRPARLLYHHLNASTQGMVVRAQIVNDSDRPARIVVIPGDAKPDRNPVLAGYRAAEEYVKNWMVGSGEVIDLPARTSMPVSIRRLAPGETMSGLCSLRLVDGPADVLVRTDAYPPFAAIGPWVAALQSATPWREVGASPVTDYDLASHEISAHVYPDPQKAEQSWHYRVGERHQFVRIGEKAIARQDRNGQLDGNFGVFYRIRADLENPTAAPALVDLQFIPSAGYSGALFILDGVFLRSPLLQPQSPWRLTQVRLEPGQKKTLHIQTIPLSGSSYPATLHIGATGQMAALQVGG